MSTDSPHSRLVGSPTPRLWTPPLRDLNEETSHGPAVVAYGRRLGIEWMPWQEWALVHGLELRPEGGYRFRTVLVVCSRQNGKTTIAQGLSLWRMATPRTTVLGTSTNLDYAREAWEAAVELAEDALPGKIDRVLRGAINTQMRMRNGSRYKIAAANRKGGRSLSVDLGITDELREHAKWDAWGAISGTTTARPDPQIWGFSNAGDETSVVLNHLRAAAVDWINTGEGDDTLALFEWSAPDGCDLDDEVAWAQANPALGYTITGATLRSKLAASPPAVFRTEHLCQNVAVIDGAIDMAAWQEGADQGSLDGLRDRVALCLDVAMDLGHVTLAAAACTPDGRVRVEVVDAWDTPRAALRDLPDLLARIKPRAVGWFPGGPAAALAAELGDMKRAAPVADAAATGVCMGFAEQVLARRVLHPADPLLDTQLAGAARVAKGDGWRFTRRGVGHVDAVYAAAGAVHLARTMPAPAGRPRLIVAA